MSDHLSWPCSIDSILAKNTHRRMNILALNSGHSPHSITTEGRTFDIAPTLLSLLEIQTNYVFPLGENLLGKPMPERLQNDSTTQEEFLRAYILRKKSNYKVNEPLRIQVKDKPYAMLHIGGILVPLTVNGNGGQAFPHNEEVCIVQLDSHGKLLSYERLKSHDQLKSRLAVIDTATTQLILLGAPHALVPDWAENPSASSESWLIYKYKNQMVQKLSNEPTALSISEDEIKR